MCKMKRGKRTKTTGVRTLSIRLSNLRFVFRLPLQEIFFSFFLVYPSIVLQLLFSQLSNIYTLYLYKTCLIF